MRFVADILCQVGIFVICHWPNDALAEHSLCSDDAETERAKRVCFNSSFFSASTMISIECFILLLPLLQSIISNGRVLLLLLAQIKLHSRIHDERCYGKKKQFNISQVLQTIIRQFFFVLSLFQNTSHRQKSCTKSSGANSFGLTLNKKRKEKHIKLLVPILRLISRAYISSRAAHGINSLVGCFDFNWNGFLSGFWVEHLI